MATWFYFQRMVGWPGTGSRWDRVMAVSLSVYISACASVRGRKTALPDFDRGPPGRVVAVSDFGRRCPEPVFRPNRSCRFTGVSAPDGRSEEHTSELQSL